MSNEQIVDGRLAGPVSEPAALRALADPTRFAIYSAIAWGGASTIREVAEVTGKRASSLYRHFDKLVGLGVLQVVGEVPTPRRPAKVFAAPEDAHLLFRPEDEGAVDALNAIVSSAARHAARGFERATRAGRAGRATVRGPRRDTHMATQSGWFTPDELGELNALVDRLRELVQKRTRRPGTRLVELNLVFSPPGPAEPPAKPSAQRPADTSDR